jgi:hypothetical protein
MVGQSGIFFLAFAVTVIIGFGFCVTTLDWFCKLLLAVASTFIFGSDPRGTHDHIFLSQDSGSRSTNNI